MLLEVFCAKATILRTRYTGMEHLIQQKYKSSLAIAHIVRCHRPLICLVLHLWKYVLYGVFTHVQTDSAAKRFTRCFSNYFYSSRYSNRATFVEKRVNLKMTDFWMEFGVRDHDSYPRLANPMLAHLVLPKCLTLCKLNTVYLAVRLAGS